MNVWTTKDFTGHWPVGTAAAVVAETAQQAAELLNIELRRRGLEGDANPERMQPLPTNAPGCVVLCDGNY